MRLPFSGKITFNRNELAGSFGDIGTDLPLIIGMVLACGLNGATSLMMFGLMQIMTGLVYGIPMPVQPLKAMAVIMITQSLTGDVLYGAGLAIGIIMLFLTLTGLLDWLARVIPKCVVRGIQFGLGVSLTTLALNNYVQAEGLYGYGIAAICFALIISLQGNRKFPPALFVILIGIIYALFFKMDLTKVWGGLGVTLPQLHIPKLQDILTGLVVLALPQIPLSVSNSIIATKQTVRDLFPGNPIGTKKIGLTYSLMNLINPFFGGIPTCHGAGGLAGHYTFGARTGGSVIIYGLIYLLTGLFFGGVFEEVVKVFPFPILGVILLFEGLALMSFIKDITEVKSDLFVALLVAVIAVGLPQGYVIGLLVGTALVYLKIKSETRNPKFETNSNFQNSNISNKDV